MTTGQSSFRKTMPVKDIIQTIKVQTVPAKKNGRKQSIDSLQILTHKKLAKCFQGKRKTTYGEMVSKARDRFATTKQL